MLSVLDQGRIWMEIDNWIKAGYYWGMITETRHDITSGNVKSAVLWHTNLNLPLVMVPLQQVVKPRCLHQFLFVVIRPFDSSQLILHYCQPIIAFLNKSFIFTLRTSILFPFKNNLGKSFLCLKSLPFFTKQNFVP